MITPSAIVEPANRPRRYEWLWPVVVVLLVAGGVRLWATAGLSLVVTNDGTGYIQMAERFARGEGMQVGVLRTPGYPAMLGVVVWLCGKNPVAVLVFHHAIGCLSACLVAFAGVKLAGRRVGTVVGVLFALDPWLLGLESYLLTEAATVGVLVCVVVFALCSRAESVWGWVWRGAMLGMLLGAGCLIRPAVQSMVPFVGLAWLVRCALEYGWRGEKWFAPIAAGVAVAASFSVVSAPWLVHNARRDIRGFARGTEMVPWLGFATNGLLDDSFHLDEPLAKEYAVFKTLPVNDFSIWQFFDNAQVLSYPDRLKVLGAWCKASATKSPGKYVKAAVFAAAWQLNVFPASGPFHDNETRRYLKGLALDASVPPYSCPAPNLHTANIDPTITKELQMWGTGGPLRGFFAWFSDKVPEGLHQVPLFVFGTGAMLMAVWKRRWDMALVFAGILAFWGAHVAMLALYSRYAMPAWGAWYVAVAYSFGGIGAGRTRAGDETRLEVKPGLADRSFRGVDGRVAGAAAPQVAESAAR